MIVGSTIGAGVVLTLLGVVPYVTLLATAGPEDKVSPTALIPAIFGVLFIVCGALALKASLRKHAMHAAAVLALLGALGGLRGFAGLPALLSGTAEQPMAVTSQVILSLICAALLAGCIGSFVAARKARQAAEAAAAGESQPPSA